MDFIEYKRFAAFFKENYDKTTKIMIIAGIIATLVGGIPAVLGFFRVSGFSDLKLYFLIVAIAGVVVWGFGSGRVVKDFEFDDIFYRMSRMVKDKCESKFGYAEDLKNAVMFEGYVIGDEDAATVKKFGNVCVAPMARICYVYSRKEKLYTYTCTFSLTEPFLEEKEYDVHYSVIESAEYITKEITPEITTNKIVIKDKDRVLLDAFIKVSDYDCESFPEKVIHRRNHILSRM